MKLLQQIHERANQAPEGVAFVSRDQKLTYRQLWEQSDALAAWIAGKLPDDDSPVAVYGHMHPEMVVCFLACVKAGHAYIPIDESTPAERVSRIITNSKTKLVLSPSSAFPQIAAEHADKIGPAELAGIVSDHVGQKPDPELSVSGDDNFYIIYTSGSTGDPKGVQITHDNLSSFVEWTLDEFKLKEAQVFLNQAPFSFDLSVMDLYPCLVTGGTLWAADKEMIARPKDLFQALPQSGIQVWTSTPSFAEMCLTDKSFGRELLPQVETFLFCGEVLSNLCARKLTERFPGAAVYNTYGPTEATVAVTSVLVSDQVLSDYAALPVGYCKPDCRLLIVDESGAPVPDGEKGEIVIVGPSVSKGYLGSPELTERSFRTIDGQRAYKTGDAGYLQNGLLGFGGRLDFQIKLHGYRMELEEIENNLRSLSLVKSAVVLPVYKDGKCEYLTAVVVPAEHSFEKEYQLTAAIKKEMGRLLPAYMIPLKFVYKEMLPMTANGKVNRKQLLGEV